MLSLLVALCVLRHVICDLGFYANTNVVFTGDSELNELKSVSIDCDYITSSSYLAGTNDQVFITFVGEHSSSGPHLVGGFKTGSTLTLKTKLTRVIGVLTNVLLQKKGTDGWLLSKLRCRMEGKSYELSGLPLRQWLDNFDPITANENGGDGYEPQAHIYLPASSQIQLVVDEIYHI